MRPEVLRDLVRVRPQRTPGQRAEQRLLSAHANRKVGRTRTPAFGVTHERFHDAVLE